MNGAEAEVLLLAERQYSVFHRSQAVALGLTERQIDRRVLGRRFEVLHPGVYRVPGSVRSARQRAMAACLWLGEDALLSELTAGALLKLDGVRTREIHVLLPGSARHRSAELIVVRRTSNLPRIDRTAVDRLPCTSATRTLIELARTLDDEALEVAFESARRMGLTSPAALAHRFGALGGRGRPGSAAIRRLLAHQQPGTRPLEYRLEVKTARLLRSARVVAPLRQFWIVTPEGERYRLDFAWPDVRVAVECEGFEVHGGRLAWKRDRRRVAAIEAMQWRIVHVTWDDVVQRSAETIDRIVHALSSAT